MHKKPDKEGLEGSSLAERLERLYQMAEHYNEVDDKEINPSVDSLAAVSQRYQSPELIAKGGMKRVYKVYDARAKRSLALAMLRDDVAEDLRDPFIHEAWLAAQLDHPNPINGICNFGLARGLQQARRLLICQNTFLECY